MENILEGKMKWMKRLGFLLVTVMLLMGSVQVFAASEDTEGKNNEVIKEGVYIGDVNVGNLTYKEAKEAVQSKVKELSGAKVTLTVNNDTIDTTLKQLGYKWANSEVLDEAVELGKSGNIIKRYKDELDLKNEGMKYSLNMDFNESTLKKKLKSQCDPYNIEAQNASLEATGHGFKIIPEKEGCVVDYDKTTENLYEYVTKKWDGKSDIAFETVTEVSKPKYTTEDCEKVSNEPMGSWTTYFTTGAAYDNRNLNIKNGAEKINGNVLYPGESFSCNDHLVPWTEDNGWYPAGTYVDGGVEDSLGGGICQVSSTLYNALLRAEIKITERYSHSMAVSYVDLAADAALAGDYKDLVFENDTDAPIYIQGIYGNGSITFNIYGHDTRSESHSVKYESELVSTTPIKTETKKDPTQPVGYSEITSTGHTGYVAKLWKITYEDGKQVSKELLHTSTYAMSPTIKTVGTKKKEEETTKPKEKPTKSDKEETTKAKLKKNNE